MANTFTQMYVQIIFCPKGRENLIHQKFEERLYQYITGIVKERELKLIAINGMPDSVAKYVMNQKEHHRKKSFREEYLQLLQKFEIEYDEKYLFEFYDELPAR